MFACLGLLALGTTLPAADRKNEWDSVDRIVEPFLEGQAEQLPFSFRYGGVSSRECIGGWEQTKIIQEVDACRTKVSIKFLDPATGLEFGQRQSFIAIILQRSGCFGFAMVATNPHLC